MGGELKLMYLLRKSSWVTRFRHGGVSLVKMQKCRNPDVAPDDLNPPRSSLQLKSGWRCPELNTRTFIGQKLYREVLANEVEFWKKDAVTFSLNAPDDQLGQLSRLNCRMADDFHERCHNRANRLLNVLCGLRLFEHLIRNQVLINVGSSSQDQKNEGKLWSQHSQSLLGIVVTCADRLIKAYR
jgi:hypothetical protein